MPVLTNPMDEDVAAQLRASQTDPLVMYFVAPRRAANSAGDLLVAAAHSALACHQYASSPAWVERWQAWEATSFRKVALRARPSDYERLASFEAARTEIGDEAVLCLPPRYRSEVEAELKKLQAHTGGALQAGEAAAVGDQQMLFVVPSDVEMTLGKAMAQIGHAALMSLELFPVHGQDVSEWQRDPSSAVCLADRDVINRLREELDVVAVKDAGLSQVKTGTETVYALAPSIRPQWLLDALSTVV